LFRRKIQPFILIRQDIVLLMDGKGALPSIRRIEKTEDIARQIIDDGLEIGRRRP